MWKDILETALTAFSMALVYMVIDAIVSLKPIVHKYVHSKTLVNVYDMLSKQAPQFVQAVAMNKNFPQSETRQAAAAKLSELVSRNGFDVSTDTINRYINEATDAYKAADGKFVQSSNELAQEVLDSTYNSLVAQNGNVSDDTNSNVPSQTTVSVNGGEINGK